MADVELDVIIDDEPYLIGYNIVNSGEYLNEWRLYADVQCVYNSQGQLVDIDSNEIFFRKCEAIANEDWQAREYNDYFEED